MRPAEYPESSIIEAGEKLEAQGVRVTPYAIREEIGGGGPNRIRNVWDKHVAERAAAPSAPEPTDELPTEIEDDVDGALAGLGADIRMLVSRIHRKAHTAAQEKTREALAALNQAEEQVRREMKDAERLITRQDETIANLQSSIQEERQRRDAAEKEVALVKGRLAEAEHDRAALAQAQQEIGRARAELDELKRALDRSSADHERLTTTLDAAKNDISALTAEVSGLTAAVSHAEQTADQLRIQAKEATERERAAVERASEMKGRLDHSSEEIEKLRAEIAGLRQ
jgi:colicin import membrane protein